MTDAVVGERVTDSAVPIEDVRTESVDQASRRRQAHRVLMASFYGLEVPDWLQTGLAEGIGSICLFGSNLSGDDEQVRRLAAELHAAAPDDTLVTLDEEGGDVTRLDARRGSPTAGHAVLGATDDVTLTRQVATGLGIRLRDLGIDLDLGPVADVNCEPDNPVIGVRSFGAEPALVARHVEAFVGGLQAVGVAACVKHFPGHGATVDDSHLAVPRLDIDLDTLRARELVPFAAAVRAGAAAVMTSHIVITALDAQRPATTSAPVLDLLRQELGFDGVLVTDALDMVGASRPYGGIPNAAVAALIAGADLLCIGPDHFAGEQEALLPQVVDAVLTAVQDGRLAPERLAEAADRVDRLINRLSRFPAPTGEFADADPNPVAAARALHLEGDDVPDLTGAVVVEFDVTPGIAAGVVPWGLTGPLGRVRPGIERRGASAAADVGEYLQGTESNRPMVAVVRDAHRHPWVAAQLAELATTRPDLIVVETGWPVVNDQGKLSGLPGATRMWTYGGSAVTLQAAAERLVSAELPGASTPPAAPTPTSANDTRTDPGGPTR